ncbi:MAG: ABC transporter substrate-binding protein [Actinomycetota bacterium]|nr:ABC transporter substrate-binding protein [Actinomycetota bacterium]
MRKRLIASGIVFLLFASGCGQKPNVHVLTAGTQSAGNLTGNAVAAGPASQAGPQTTGGSVGSSAVAHSSTAKAAANAGTGSNVATSGDSTGVSKTTIIVGFHAPITGAASVPLTDIRYGADLLAAFFKKHGATINGRLVQTFIEDDQYNPSHATAVCRDLAEQKHAFFLVGGGGTDQVVACARYAATKGIPYLSPGVTENTVKSLRNYFAITPSYPQQAKPLVELIHNVSIPAKANDQPGPVFADRCNETTLSCADPFKPLQAGPNQPKVAMIYSDTDGFYDARDAFVKEMKSQMGLDCSNDAARTPRCLLKTITKYSIDSSTAGGIATTFKQSGYDVVYILTAPTNWITLMNATDQQSYWPLWVGVGVTDGLNIVTTIECKSHPAGIQNSLFFSPWFSVYDPGAAQFADTWNNNTPAGATPDPHDHDLAFAVFGGAITQAAILTVATNNPTHALTRQSFMAAMEKLQNFTWQDSFGYPNPLHIDQVYSTVGYSPTDHFGAHQVNLVWAHCSGNQQGASGYFDFFPGLGKLVTGF